MHIANFILIMDPMKSNMSLDPEDIIISVIFNLYSPLRKIKFLLIKR